MKVERQVRETICQQDLIAPGDHVVLGLSGGADSLCLLHVLLALSGPLSFTLSALHLNHLMRGFSAFEDEAFLREHCRDLGLPLRVRSASVEALARRRGQTVEEAGRQQRQAVLAQEKERLSREGLEVRLALAHNRNDQAETVLLRLLRGTGIRGLAAMAYAREDGIIRPLLDVDRQDIEAYCRQKGLTPRWDATNASTDFTRNALRLELMPQLKARYNPALDQALVRLASQAREDEACLQELAGQALASLGRQAAAGDGSACLILGRKQLAALKPALAKRVIRLAFESLGLTQDIASVHLEAFMAGLTKGAGNKTFQFPSGYRVWLGGGEVHLLGPGQRP